MWKKLGIEPDIETVKDEAVIYSSGSEVYREIVTNLKMVNMQLHWHMLKKDKPLKTVIKVIPTVVDTEEVRKTLEEKGIKVDSVVSLRRDSANSYDIVAVTSERFEEGKKTIELEKLGCFRVRVEGKKKPTAQKCYRCQEFGHVQFRCTARDVFGFCGQGHPSQECQKPRGRGQAASILSR